MSWYPLAVRVHGPTDSVWPEKNLGAGVILHSSEGYRDGMTARLWSGAVSWAFSIYQTGRVEQHYDTSASCWHAGSHYQNNRLIGIEHEGVAGEPLTAPQLASSIALVKWLSNVYSFPMVRHVGLIEHNEVYGTSCPSGRIPWEKYLEEPMVELDPVLDSEEIALILDLLHKFTVGGAVELKKVRGSSPTEYRLVVH